MKNAVVYDVETLPNCFTLYAIDYHGDIWAVWVLSEFRDDRASLLSWLNELRRTQTPMIGFNNVHFDYSVIHFLMNNPTASVKELYDYAMHIINSDDKFGNTIWLRDRLIPQIDLYKIHHFDNNAKRTSLKALEIAMRSTIVSDMPVKLGINLTEHQINNLLIPYNAHDVKETKKFATHSIDAIEFREKLSTSLPGDVMNMNDSKLGSAILENRLGEEICYTRSNGRRQIRQTPRYQISLAEIIFPYIHFNNPEFIRVLNFLKTQVLTPDELSESQKIVTKGAFSKLTAFVGGMTFVFGTGGIHGSVPAQIVQADDNHLIRDIDVASLYPSIAVVNRLSPEHLGEVFVSEYAGLLTERKKHAKGTVENAALKLAANGTYGNSNSAFSVFYDPKFTMTITINGQLMLCMLAEQLCNVPSLQLIQINTDGITYRINKQYEPQAKAICEAWEQYTLLKLEGVNYSRVFIRDVNNYIAETTDGKLKQKGNYWFPDPNNYAESISKASPPAWHKDLSNLISIKAAVLQMVKNIPIEFTIRTHVDPFDFMIRAKIDKKSMLMLGETEIQKTSRVYVATDGEPLFKVSPPVEGAEIGDFKRKSKLDENIYRQVIAEIGSGVWDERIHTKNKSKHELRRSAICAGWKLAECNDARNFDFARVNYDYYIAEAKKLLIG